jgi:hypothetical protein
MELEGLLRVVTLQVGSDNGSGNVEEARCDDYDDAYFGLLLALL